MTDDEISTLASALFDAIERGDLDAIDAIYSDDLVMWSNIDVRPQDKARSLKVLGWLCTKLSDRRYEITRRLIVPGGFVQEHVLHGTAPDGSAVANPACIIADVADGKFVQMHEYLDPAGVAALSR
jgi:ketosteroid isomerase-like protein